MILCPKHCWMSWLPGHCSSRYCLGSICNDHYLDVQYHSRWLGLPKIAEAWCWNPLSDHLPVWLNMPWRILFDSNGSSDFKSHYFALYCQGPNSGNSVCMTYLCIGLTWHFSLFSNSLAHMLHVWLNFYLLECCCDARLLLHRLQDMVVLILSLALVELYWETEIQTSYNFLQCHKPDWIDLMARRERYNLYFLIIFILIYLVRSKTECKICCLTIDLKLLYTKSSKGQKFNSECTVRTMFYEHKEVFFIEAEGYDDFNP